TTPSGSPVLPVIDPDALEKFTHSVIGDLGAAVSGVLIHIGDRLGLYRALGDSAPVTSVALSARTGLAERYVREWLHNQAAAGWVSYDSNAQTFTLPPEHALLVSDPNAPTFLLGGFDIAASIWGDEHLLTDAFRSGAGIGWHEHDERLFEGTERFFRPGYQANLVSTWLPALNGVVERLEAGIDVADVGCGFGASTIVMARAFPQSTFVGYDYHDASIVAARRRAAEAGLSNVTFEVDTAKAVPGQFDLVCLFDCLHDMGDPEGAACRLRSALRPGGSLLLVEPAGADRPEDNHNPLGRLFYGCSTALCVPSSLAQEGGLGLGNQAGQPRMNEILTQAGFSSIRVVDRSPINVVMEVRP
ncbi:MAG TPA: class I SAM-dependent methyltransferase, partial [Candidatus Lustribacter sp.]|nr:class I SAM-dependent methyltransferase [Candidatus Lustribacter sp.]